MVSSWWLGRKDLLAETGEDTSVAPALLFGGRRLDGGLLVFEEDLIMSMKKEQRWLTESGFWSVRGYLWPTGI